MKSNTATTSGNFRTLSLTDQLVSVKLIKDPIELGYALRRIYSNYVYEFDEECAKQKKRRHMEEIKEAGNDYEI